MFTRLKFTALVFLVTLGLDWGSKLWAVQTLPALQLNALGNSGPFFLAWGINQNLSGGLSALRPLTGLLLVAMLGVGYLFVNWGRGPLPLAGIGFIWAAIVGNGLERLVTGGGIDFLGLALPNQTLIVANLADLIALLGILCLILATFLPSRYGWVEPIRLGHRIYQP
jgi:lipoprotein signal peptidase